MTNVAGVRMRGWGVGGDVWAVSADIATLIREKNTPTERDIAACS